MGGLGGLHLTILTFFGRMLLDINSELLEKKSQNYHFLFHSRNKAPITNNSDKNKNLHNIDRSKPCCM